MVLYRVTLKPVYYQAAKELRQRLAASCGLDAGAADPSNTSSSTHEAQRPCVAQAFLADYAAEFQRPQDFPALTPSFAASTRPAANGREESPLLASAWTAVSLVDSLPYYPQDDPERVEAVAALNRLAADFEQHQDRNSGVLRIAHEDAQAHVAVSPDTNWLFVYALLKGVRLGYLPPSYRTQAVRAWNAVLAKNVRLDASKHLVLTSTPNETNASSSARTVDPDSPDSGAPSLGAFLLASTEMDLSPASRAGHGAIVLLDAWYNSQQRKNAAGQMESFHYKWSDDSDSGYSLFGHMLRSAGLATATLPAAPTPGNLRNAAYYLIVSPDIPVKNPNPDYISEADADVVAAWVKDGGVLILMENDPPNADITHMNLLADRFGIHFDDVLHHHILGEHVEDGRIPVAGGGPLFHEPHTLYMKDTCAISLTTSARALLRDRGDVVMATARYGRGTVFAAVDPWLYNEYTDGRNNPAIYSQFDNFAAGREFVRWLIQQRPEQSIPAKVKAKP
jgi:unsaturated rhamnogalacturonyl hydrolase